MSHRHSNTQILKITQNFKKKNTNGSPEIPCVCSFPLSDCRSSVAELAARAAQYIHDFGFTSSSAILHKQVWINLTSLSHNFLLCKIVILPLVYHDRQFLQVLYSFKISEAKVWSLPCIWFLIPILFWLIQSIFFCFSYLKKYKITPFLPILYFHKTL